MLGKRLKAKLDVLKSMKDETKKADIEGSGLADGIKNKSIEKVTVMAEDKKGLKKGLSLAQKLMELRNGDLEEEKEEEKESETLEELKNRIKKLSKSKI